MRPKNDSNPDQPRREIVHEMTYPSGGVVLLDAGSLLAATPDDLYALQAQLREVASRRTPEGRPFRTQAEDTPVGDVMVAPVRGRELPHTVKIVWEDGRARRVVVELAKPGGGGTLALLTQPVPAAPALASLAPSEDAPPPRSEAPHPLIAPSP